MVRWGYYEIFTYGTQMLRNVSQEVLPRKRCLQLLTKRYNSDGLEKSRVDDKISFQITSQLRRDTEALDNNGNYNYKHAN